MSAPSRTSPASASAPTSTPATTHSARTRLVTVVLAIVIPLLALVALGLGDYPLSPIQVASAMFGRDGFAATIVLQWRAPRVLGALAFGAALAASGALFQSVTRNPLGSPDIVGLGTGAYTGVLCATLVAPGIASATAGALLGGLATAAVVYLLAYRGGVQGFRLIVVGLAVTAALNAINRWLLLTAPTQAAMGASIWGAGSLSGIDWAHTGPALIVLAVLVPPVLALSGPLRQLELGDDAAAAHGLRVEPARLAIIAVAVALVAIATAVAGPIAFISLAAPQIAARLGAGSGLPLLNSALLGAAGLLIADQVGQHLMPTEIPVGLVTLVLGGGYLLALLWREVRRRA